MTNTVLRINGLNVDYQAGGDIAPLLVLQLQEFGRLASVTANGVKRSIELPSTAINRQALASGRAPTTLTVSGIEVFRGEALVTQRTRRGDIERSISVTLVGGNSAWSADRRLADIVGNYADHALDFSTVETALSAVTGSGAFAYAPIKRGKWATVGQVQHWECTPLLFVRQILERAALQAGYTLHSDFFQSGVYQNLVLPVLLPEKYGDEYGEDFLNERWSESGQALPANSQGRFDFTNVVHGTGNWDSVNMVYNVAEDGFYKTTIRLTIESDSPSDASQVFVLFRKNNIEWQTVYAPQGIPSQVDVPAGGLRTVTLTAIFEAAAGDTLDFYWITPFALVGITAKDILMEIRGETKIQSGSTIRFKYLLGNLNLRGLIAGLTHCFNLVWQVNEGRRTIQVEPADDYLDVRAGTMRSGFYSQTALQSGLTADTSQQTIEKRFAAEEFWQLGYEADDDTLENIDRNQPMPSQSARYQFQNPDKVGAISELNNPFFAKTGMYFDSEISVFDTPAPPQPVASVVSIPLIYQGDIFEDANSKPRQTAKPRLLLRVTSQLTLDGQVAAGAFNFEGAAFPLSIETLSIGANQFNLNQPSLTYGDVIVRGVTVPGLMRCFYTQHLARLNRGEVREERYFLRLADVVRFDFRAKLYRDNVRWVIYSVDGFNPTSPDSTKLIILRDAAPNPTRQMYSNTPPTVNLNPIA